MIFGQEQLQFLYKYEYVPLTYFNALVTTRYFLPFKKFEGSFLFKKK